MAHIFIILAHDPTVRPTFDDLNRYSGADSDIYAAFLDDSLALAGQAYGARLSVIAQVDSGLVARLQALAGPRIILLPDLSPASLMSILSEALSDGPVVLFGGDMPHLPIWRLRDALTHLEGDADLVVGPGETRGWYLIGLRAAHPALLRTLPGSDDPPDDLCIAAATHGLRVAQLPAWYTLDTLADLDRLATDLRTMPPDIAPQTRHVLNSEISSHTVGA
ncbi:MAG: DUF2064 domain-containing protein [Chloroflexales bacterium]